MQQDSKQELVELWKGRIADWARSGGSIAKWCRDHDVSDHLFYYWRDRLSGKSRKSRAKERIQQPTDKKMFIELKDQPGNHLTIESGSFRIKVTSDCDEALLIRSLRAVKQASC